MKLVPVEIRQVQAEEQEEEFQRVYDVIRGRVDLEKPMPDRPAAPPLVGVLGAKG